MIEVLSIASEIVPLVKTGGLADVVGALPAALAPFGVRVTTLVPGYPAVIAALADPEVLWSHADYFGGPARLLKGRAAALDLLVLDAGHLYGRPGNPYIGPDGRDWPDNARRFAALSFMAYELGAGLVPTYRPEILHAHDWQTGLVPAYARFNAPTGVKTVLTVHNIAFQGVFGWDVFNALRLDYRAAGEGALEYWGNLSFLKAGLQTADAVTTVSPTYAHEIRTAEYGMGLEGLLRARADSLFGILNGIDTRVWDPGHDPALAVPYGVHALGDRAQNRAALEERFGLEPGEGPLFSVVSRLTWQKGLDLLVPHIDMIVENGGRLVVLGSGDAALEQAFRAAAARHPGKVGVMIGYDEPLSHLVQGGADVMLVPSRFEPCGLTQLYALRYGSIPLVARVGGLADTVIDANAAALDAGAATGIVFSPVTEEALGEALRRGFALYQQPKVWRKMQRRGLKSDVSWDKSARHYADLYATLTGREHHADPND
jgi:starch synthase